MNTSKKILWSKLWDQRIEVRSAIRNQNFQINKIRTLNELDKLISIENEILDEFDQFKKLREETFYKTKRVK
tara:strand:- start:62 stop:277 length:216 start_codon:yes stop_codon:yes gene_type:complete